MTTLLPTSCWFFFCQPTKVTCVCVFVISPPPSQLLFQFNHFGEDNITYSTTSIVDTHLSYDRTIDLDFGQRGPSYPDLPVVSDFFPFFAYFTSSPPKHALCITNKRSESRQTLYLPSKNRHNLCENYYPGILSNKKLIRSAPTDYFASPLRNQSLHKLSLCVRKQRQNTSPRLSQPQE